MHIIYEHVKQIVSNFICILRKGKMLFNYLRFESVEQTLYLDFLLWKTNEALENLVRDENQPIKNQSWERQYRPYQTLNHERGHVNSSHICRNLSTQNWQSIHWTLEIITVSTTYNRLPTTTSPEKNQKSNAFQCLKKPPLLNHYVNDMCKMSFLFRTHGILNKTSLTFF